MKDPFDNWYGTEDDEENDPIPYVPTGEPVLTQLDLPLEDGWPLEEKTEPDGTPQYKDAPFDRAYALSTMWTNWPTGHWKPIEYRGIRPARVEPIAATDPHFPHRCNACGKDAYEGATRTEHRFANDAAKCLKK